MKQRVRHALEKMLTWALPGADDGTVTQHYEPVLVRLAERAEPMVLPAIEAVRNVGLAGGTRAAAVDAFAEALLGQARGKLAATLRSAPEDANQGESFPEEIAWTRIRERIDAAGAELRAAGRDAVLLRLLAERYDYRAVIALSEKARRLEERTAQQLREIADLLDRRAARGQDAVVGEHTPVGDP